MREGTADYAWSPSWEPFKKPIILHVISEASDWSSCIGNLVDITPICDIKVDYKLIFEDWVSTRNTPSNDNFVERNVAGARRYNRKGLV